MKQPPKNRTRIRLTVDLLPEVYEAYRNMAEAQRLGIGRVIGDWLEETLDAAAFVSEAVTEARRKPKQVAQRLHSYALGLATAAEGLIAEAKGPGLAAHAPAGAPGPGPKARNHPPGNTGGNDVTNRRGSS